MGSSVHVHGHILVKSHPVGYVIDYGCRAQELPLLKPPDSILMRFSVTNFHSVL